MTKTLHSLLEMAVVIGGLAGAPFLVVTSLAPVAAVAQSEQVPLAMAQDVAASGPSTAELRF